MSTTRTAHKASLGTWPEDFPVNEDGTVEEGLVVWSRSRKIEGRTTGARLRCTSLDCPGWFIGVTWETGQRLRPCSEGWHYDPTTKSVRITGGGEISARVITPAPLGEPPIALHDWPPRSSFANSKGWRKLKRR